MVDLLDWLWTWQSPSRAPVNIPMLTRKGRQFWLETQTPAGSWVHKTGSVTVESFCDPDEVATIHGTET